MMRGAAALSPASIFVTPR